MYKTRVRALPLGSSVRDRSLRVVRLRDRSVFDLGFVSPSRTETCQEKVIFREAPLRCDRFTVIGLGVKGSGSFRGLNGTRFPSCRLRGVTNTPFCFTRV